MNLNLEDKVVLVINGDLAIGRKIATEFTLENSRVIIHHQNNKNFRIEEFQQQTLAGKYQATEFRASLTNFDEPKKMIEEIITQYGKIDVFIYTHDRIPPNSMRKIDYQTWNSTVRKGLKKLFFATYEVSRLMVKQKMGRIITVTSGIGARGHIELIDICTVGAGIIGFTKSLSKEMLPYNVSVNCVTFGVMEDDFNDSLPELQQDYRKSLDYLKISRLGTPQDIANMVLFLSSEKGAYISGQTFSVNGGLLV